MLCLRVRKSLSGFTTCLVEERERGRDNLVGHRNKAIRSSLIIIACQTRVRVLVRFEPNAHKSKWAQLLTSIYRTFYPNTMSVSFSGSFANKNTDTYQQKGSNKKNTKRVRKKHNQHTCKAWYSFSYRAIKTLFVLFILEHSRTCFERHKKKVLG